MKLRKGDAPKAAVLVILIVAVLAFVGRTLMSASGGGARGRVSAKTQATGDQPARKPVAEQMYAERPRDPVASTAKAKGAANPFLPAISTRRAGATSAAGKTPPPVPEFPNLRFLGTVASDMGVMAVLTDGGQRYYVRQGESLPGGWSVGQVGSRSITLQKGGQKVALVLD
jgi:hypothetical protein